MRTPSGVGLTLALALIGLSGCKSSLDDGAVDGGASGHDASVTPDDEAGDSGTSSQDASAKSDSMDVSWTDDAGEVCSCGSGVGTEGSAMSWGCYCSIQPLQPCTRTLADFVDLADGGRTLRYQGGNQMFNQGDMAIEYADCNLVMVQSWTHSDYYPPSVYIFNRTTERLVGAKELLGDSHYSCPFRSPDGSFKDVNGYRSGTYPVPSTCHASSCMGSTCPSAIDARSSSESID